MGRSKKDSFFLIGISHKTAPVEIREKLSFENDRIGEILQGIHRLAGVRECVVLSTCNRTEIYATLREPFQQARDNIEAHILELAGAGSEFSRHIYMS